MKWSSTGNLVFLSRNTGKTFWHGWMGISVQVYVERHMERQVNMCFLSQVTGVGGVAGMGLVVPIAEEVAPQINGIGVAGCACLVSAQRRDQVCVLGMSGVEESLCSLARDGEETLVGVDGVRSMGLGVFT